MRPCRDSARPSKLTRSVKAHSGVIIQASAIEASAYTSREERRQRKDIKVSAQDTARYPSGETRTLARRALRVGGARRPAAASATAAAAALEPCTPAD